MEIYEMIELEDCPRCLGPSILEEETAVIMSCAWTVAASRQHLALKTMPEDLRRQKEQLNCGMPARLFSTALAIKFEKEKE